MPLAMANLFYIGTLGDNIGQVHTRLPLSSWLPPNLLGHAASAAWAMRGAHSAFGGWLREALDTDGVPRVGMCVEHKRGFEQLLMEATNWSAFKAALKQLCGGKKKQHGG